MTASAAASEEPPLPPIEARIFKATFERRSSSGKILLLQSSGPLPAAGQLVLLRGESGPLLAVRTRQLYADRRFSGQVVRTYDETTPLEEGKRYVALIKLRDLELDEEDIAALPPDDLDLELDRGRLAGTLTRDEEIELQSLVLEEVEDYEQERSLISYRIAILPLPSFDSGTIFPAASGVRYAYTLIHPFLFSGKGLQDAISVEATLLYTKLNDYTPSGGDAFALLPFLFAGRYTLYPHAGFGVSAYGGILSVSTLASKGPEPEYSQALEQLAARGAFLGLGLSFEVGPQWWLQLDLGTDQVGAGLGLKF